MLVDSHNEKKLALSFLCFLILQQQKILTLTSFFKVEETQMSHPHAPALAVLLNSAEITPLCQCLSCARTSGPCPVWVISLVLNTRQDQCLALLLWLCKSIPRCRGCFAALVHFFLGRDCCFPGTCCFSVPFLQICFCSVNPSLSCCRGESFQGLWETL